VVETYGEPTKHRRTPSSAHSTEEVNGRRKGTEEEKFLGEGLRGGEEKLIKSTNHQFL